MYRHQYSLRVAPILQVSKVSHQRKTDHQVQDIIQVQQRTPHILVLHKLFQDQGRHQMHPRTRLQLPLLFLEVMQQHHHPVHHRRVTILNIAQDRAGLLVKVRFINHNQLF